MPKPIFLIADDEKMFREEATIFLSRRGWKVVGCVNADEVVNVLPRLQRIGAALVDLSLPWEREFIGTEDLVQLLKPKCTNIGIFTGLVERETEHRASAMGVKLFYKPANFDEVVRELTSPTRPSTREQEV